MNANGIFVVLSTSVADALSYYNNPDTKDTEHLCRMFDKLFDCLNVRSPREWITKKKPNLKPYTSADDCRLEVIYKLSNNIATCIYIIL